MSNDVDCYFNGLACYLNVKMMPKYSHSFSQKFDKQKLSKRDPMVKILEKQHATPQIHCKTGNYNGVCGVSILQFFSFFYTPQLMPKYSKSFARIIQIALLDSQVL